MSKLTHCGQAIKWLFAVTNAFIVLFGLVAIAFGVLLTVMHEDLDYVTGSELYSGAVVAVTAGVVIVIVAAFGIVAGWSEVWQLLTFYNFCASGLFIVTLAGTIFSIATQDNIYQRTKDEFLTDIRSYRQENDSDYDPRTNQFVDDVQSSFQCCGLNGPGDWLNQSLDYCLDNQGLPDSCNCTSDVSGDCTLVKIPPTGLHLYTSISWNKGCDEPIDTLTFSVVLYGGMAIVAVLLCQGMAICCSCRLCYLLLRHRRRQRRGDVTTYHPLETYQKETMSSSSAQDQTSELAYPPSLGYNQHDSSYYPSSHPV